MRDRPDDDDEPYGLTWPGRRRARRLASQPPTVTLRPEPDAGLHEETTRNVFVVGDNLQVLLALRGSYARQVRLVYVDPPYNTGGDFIYRDTFAAAEADYLRESGQADDGGRLVSNPQTSGRFHSDWLSFVAPRLVAAWRLLRDDGFIVVSIDDAELANLRLLLDAICGEENFLATLVWDRNRKNDARYFSVGHEYMLVYARDRTRLQDDGTILRAPKEGVEEVRALFHRLREAHGDDWDAVRDGLRAFYATLDDDDPRRPLARYNLVDEGGPYEKGNLNWPGPGGPTYEVLHPVTGRPCKVPASGWRLATKVRFDEEVAAGRVVFGPDETTTPRAKVRLFASTRQVLGSVHYSSAQSAARRFEALFDGVRVFDHPKPVDDIAALVDYLCGPDDLVVDFFAGSGTTGHAAWLANARHGTRRRFLLVQLDAPVNPATVSGRNAAAMGLPTIDRVAIERLRRASASLAAEGATGDLGFRVLRAAPLDAASLDADDRLPDALLRLGLPLDAPLQRVPTASGALWRHGDVLLCLDDVVPACVADALAAYPGHTFACRDAALDDLRKATLLDALDRAGATLRVL